MGIINSVIRYGLVSVGIVTVLGTLVSAVTFRTETDIYRELSPSVIKLTNGRSGGTGFLVTNSKGKKYIATNFHVCDPLSNQTMQAQLKGKQPLLVKIIRYDREHDLCLLDAIEGPSVSISPSPIRDFESLFVVGHPLLHEQTPSQGRLVGESVVNVGMSTDPDGTCPKGTTPFRTFFAVGCVTPMLLAQTSLLIYPGNSGSPVVNFEGQLVGVINSADNYTAAGSFIPVRFLTKLLEQELN
jgi:S1-C subfamily serine protease